MAGAVTAVETTYRELEALFRRARPNLNDAQIAALVTLNVNLLDVLNHGTDGLDFKGWVLMSLHIALRAHGEAIDRLAISGDAIGEHHTPRIDAWAKEYPGKLEA